MPKGHARSVGWVGLKLDAKGDMVSDDSQPFDYDARTRPWFKGGMALAQEGDIFWSEPYTFRSSLEPGLSVVVRWTAADGNRYVMTSDLKLIDLSRFTRNIVAGQNGFVTVLTEDGRVIGPPKAPGFSDDASIKAAVLKPADAIGVNPLTQAFVM